tara:strand:- start:5583 stop:5816 length:234 start_codon:yes stop_codon:yes gene_type:complete
MTDTEKPIFHDTTRRPIFQPSERKILQNAINQLKTCLEANEKVLKMSEEKLEAFNLRCEELIARNNQLEERHVLNQN